MMNKKELAAVFGWWAYGLFMTFLASACFYANDERFAPAWVLIAMMYTMVATMHFTWVRKTVWSAMILIWAWAANSMISDIGSSPLTGEHLKQAFYMLAGLALMIWLYAGCPWAAWQKEEPLSVS